MKDQHTLSRISSVLLAFGLFVSGYFWVKARSEADEAVRALRDARAEIESLSAALSARIPSDNATTGIVRSPVYSLKADQTSDAPMPPLKTTVVDSNAEGTPAMSDAVASAIERFDFAMDHEFNRLEERERSGADKAEMTTIQRIKEKLSELDELYRRADLATSDEERVTIRQEMQSTMGSIIGLSRVDRNERLGSLAAQIGYTDPAAVQRFVEEIDRIYHETHMDWAKLFNRGPPAE